jgi:hypothetical protein
MRLCIREEMDDTIEGEERRGSRNGNTEEGRGVFMVAERETYVVHLLS